MDEKKDIFSEVVKEMLEKGNIDTQFLRTKFKEEPTMFDATIEEFQAKADKLKEDLMNQGARIENFDDPFVLAMIYEKQVDDILLILHYYYMALLGVTASMKAMFKLADIIDDLYNKMEKEENKEDE